MLVFGKIMDISKKMLFLQDEMRL
jgi:hypothetical protein